MKRSQKMIAVVTIVAKAERKNKDEVRTPILGYDPEVWLDIEVQIRDTDKRHKVHSKIVLPPSMNGKHKYSHCSHPHTDIHNFLGNREWAPTQQDNKTGCTT